MYIYKVFYNIKSSYKAETYFVMGKKKFQAFQPRQNLWLRQRKEGTYFISLRCEQSKTIHQKEVIYFPVYNNLSSPKWWLSNSYKVMEFYKNKILSTPPLDKREFVDKCSLKQYREDPRQAPLTFSPAVFLAPSLKLKAAPGTVQKPAFRFSLWAKLVMNVWEMNDS